MSEVEDSFLRNPYDEGHPLHQKWVGMCRVGAEYEARCKAEWLKRENPTVEDALAYIAALFDIRVAVLVACFSWSYVTAG